MSGILHKGQIFTPFLPFTETIHRIYQFYKHYSNTQKEEIDTIKSELHLNIEEQHGCENEMKFQ